MRIFSVQGTDLHSAEHFQRRHDDLRDDIPRAPAVLPRQERVEGGRGAGGGGAASGGPAAHTAAANRPGLRGVGEPKVS